MNKPWTLSFFTLAVSCTLACGSGSGGRQLQSITIAQTQSGAQVQFVATGTFSAPPTTVSPLPVDWTNQLMAPPPPTYSYTLSTAPYVYNCNSSGPAVVVAFAPPNPDAPSSGSASRVVQGAATFNCP
jgi:hypothetical protein